MSNTAPTLTVTTATADHAQHKPAQTRKPPPSFDRRLEFAGVAEAQLAQVVRYIISLSISKLVGTWPSHSTIPTFPIPTIPIPAHPVLRAFRNSEILCTCNKSAAFKLTKGSTCPPVVDVTLHSTVQCKLVCGPTLILNQRTHSHVILDKGVFQTPVQQT